MSTGTLGADIARRTHRRLRDDLSRSTRDGNVDPVFDDEELDVVERTDRPGRVVDLTVRSNVHRPLTSCAPIADGVSHV